MSKNNPENRGEVTELRKYNGKKVKPALYIGPNNEGKKSRYIAASYEDGKLAIPQGMTAPIAYSQCDAA